MNIKPQYDGMMPEQMWGIIYSEACKEYGVSIHKLKEVINNQDFKKVVSKIKQQFVMGRPTPLSKNFGRLNREAERMNMISLFRGAYPKKLRTDKDRLKYLKKLLLANEISEDRYLEFTKVLKVKEKKILAPLEKLELI